MNHSGDISNLMAQIGGLRSELTDARAHAATLADSLATTLQACADLRAERDALLVQCTVVRDATDPGPTLVAETRKAFPINTLRGGKGLPTW